MLCDAKCPYKENFVSSFSFSRSMIFINSIRFISIEHEISFFGYIKGDLIAPQNGRFPSDFKLQNVMFPGGLKATNQWRLQNDNAMIHIGVL